MRRRTNCVLILAVNLFCLPIGGQSHPFTVADDIAMARFSDPVANPAIPGSEHAKASPDGEHIVVVTTRGLLHSDQIESEVDIFETRDVALFLNGGLRSAPRPRSIAALTSFPHREEEDAYAPMIKDLQWDFGSKKIYFKGEDSNGAYRIYEARLDGKGAEPLTPSTQTIARFAVEKDLIVYTAAPMRPRLRPDGDYIGEDSRAMTGENIMSILLPGRNTSMEPETFALFNLHVNGNTPSITRASRYSILEIPFFEHLYPFAVSPQRDKLVELAPVKAIPKLWKRYEPAPGYEDLRIEPEDLRRIDPSDLSRLREYSIVDLKTGATVPLVDAPHARALGYLDQNRVAWAPSGHRVLISNTFLPLEEDAVAGASRNRYPCAVASVDLPSHRTRCLYFKEGTASDIGLVRAVAFGEGEDEALVLAKDKTDHYAIHRFSIRDERWEEISSTAVDSASDSLSDVEQKKRLDTRRAAVSVCQSLNDPPKLCAIDADTGRRRTLWDPNPQLQNMSFGQATIHVWKDSTGYQWSGVLLTPVGYQPGKRYPLVIQMYSYRKNEFMTDGLDPTAFAARHLASAGFVVLQMERKPTTLSEQDAENSLEGYRSAVKDLSDINLIDPTKVGVVGFSWTCWYAIEALIHDPHLFAAATIADGLDNSYMQYMLFGVSSAGVQRQMEAIRGGPPFGSGLQRWVAEAPGFHLDQVQTPVRIEMIGPASVLQEWELYASLEMQHKAVDLIYFPHGTHIHQKPLERLASQQGNVDWLRFWLEDYVDPDPAKTAQYRSWETLKAKAKTRSISPSSGTAIGLPRPK